MIEEWGGEKVITAERDIEFKVLFAHFDGAGPKDNAIRVVRKDLHHNTDLPIELCGVLEVHDHDLLFEEVGIGIRAVCIRRMGAVPCRPAVHQEANQGRRKLGVEREDRGRSGRTCRRSFNMMQKNSFVFMGSLGVAGGKEFADITGANISG